MEVFPFEKLLFRL